MVNALALLPVVGLLAAQQVTAYDRICRDYRTGRQYYCWSTGARIAIGVSVGVGVFIIFSLIGLMRRRQMRNKMKQYRPPPPIAVGGGDLSGNPYANNPPPPTGVYGNDSQFNAPAAPPATYQPSTTHNYGNDSSKMGSTGNQFENHDYEYQQAMQNANNSSNDGAPPSYNPTTTGYSAPAGPPPGVSSSSAFTPSSNTYSPPAQVAHGANTSDQYYSPPSGPPPGTRAVNEKS